MNHPPTTRSSGRWSGASGLDRLSPQDLSNLRVEARGLPMHVAALAILEGAPLCDAQGRLRLEVVQAWIQRRLPLAPRLRQLLHPAPLGFGPPVWADDAGFDIANHVRTRAIARPATRQPCWRPVRNSTRPRWIARARCGSCGC